MKSIITYYFQLFVYEEFVLYVHYVSVYSASFHIHIITLVVSGTDSIEAGDEKVVKIMHFTIVLERPYSTLYFWKDHRPYCNPIKTTYPKVVLDRPYTYTTL